MALLKQNKRLTHALEESCVKLRDALSVDM